MFRAGRVARCGDPMESREFVDACCVTGGVPFLIFAVGENTVGRDFALCAKHVGGQRWKVFLIPAPITLTTSVNQQLTLTWLTVKGTNVSTTLSTFKSFYKASPT